MKDWPGTYLDCIHDDIFGRRVLEILAKAPNRDTIAPNTSDVVNVDIVRLLLNSDTVVSALVYKVGQLDIFNANSICVVSVMSVLAAMINERDERVH